MIVSNGLHMITVTPEMAASGVRTYEQAYEFNSIRRGLKQNRIADKVSIRRDNADKHVKVKAKSGGSGLDLPIVGKLSTTEAIVGAAALAVTKNPVQAMEAAKAADLVSDTISNLFK